MEEALQGSQGDVRNAPKQASKILVKINEVFFFLQNSRSPHGVLVHDGLESPALLDVPTKSICTFGVEVCPWPREGNGHPWCTKAPSSHGAGVTKQMLKLYWKLNKR